MARIFSIQWKIDRYINNGKPEKLLGLFRKSSYIQRSRIIKSILANKYSPFFQIIAGALNDPSQSVRVTAAEAILNWKPKSGPAIRAQAVLDEMEETSPQKHHSEAVHFQKRNWSSIIKEQLKKPMHR